MAKLFASEASMKITTQAVQFSEDTDIPTIILWKE